MSFRVVKCFSLSGGYLDVELRKLQLDTEQEDQELMGQVTTGSRENGTGGD